MSDFETWLREVDDWPALSAEQRDSLRRALEPTADEAVAAA